MWRIVVVSLLAFAAAWQPAQTAMMIFVWCIHLPVSLMLLFNRRAQIWLSAIRKIHFGLVPAVVAGWMVFMGFIATGLAYALGLLITYQVLRSIELRKHEHQR